jgi:hypothetical protein
VPVRIGTVVMAGDQVTLPTGGTLVLRLADGERREMRGPRTYDVPSSPSLGKLASIFGSIPALFDDEFRQEGTAAARGGEKCSSSAAEAQPIEIPILAPGARIVAGERDLPLAWRGGCPPFVVTLWSGRAQADRPRVDRGPAGAARRPAARAWPLRAHDRRRRRSRGSCDRRGVRRRGPTLPAELASDTSALGVIAQAVWLAQQDAGRWRLDGFERLRPLIRSGDSLAGQSEMACYGARTPSGRRRRRRTGPQ